MTVGVRLVQVLDGRDRVLLDRCALPRTAPAWRRRAWIAVTHAGGAAVTIAAVALPLLTGLWSRVASAQAAIALTVSHLIVQLMKRSVHRARPLTTPHIRCPDRFSFPSGHATAALAVATSYGLAFPALAPPLVGLALVVGWSRVVLGVHYPGDVLMGQGLAVITALLVAATGPG